MSSRRCRSCHKALPGDFNAWFIHVSRCRPVKKRRVQEDVADLEVGPMRQRTDGHRSFVSGASPGRASRMSRSERQRVYADNSRRDERGFPVAPMPLMSELPRLHGRTELEQDGIARRCLEELRSGRRVIVQQPVPFGAGV